MVSISPDVLFELASVTISSPLNRLPTFFNAFKDRSNNASSKDLRSLAMEAEVLRLVEPVAPLIVPGAGTTTKALEVQAPSTIQMLPV